MTSAYFFNKTGYDPFIDFIKAYAIICVLIGHTLPVTGMGYGLWAGMQVPLFILVQTFHYYKKEDSKLNITKLFQRIILPFIVIGLLEFGVLCILNGGGDNLALEGIKNGGGYGPGSYFPLIYIQIALLLPCFRGLFNRFSSNQLLCLFLLIAEGLEILCSLLQLPDWIYRLLAIRYVFLIYLGWEWVRDGIKLNWKMIALSVLSALTIIYFEDVSSFFHINNEPWFFNTAWKFHRWPCYYYCANGLVYLLYMVWRRIKNNAIIWKGVKILAKSSYEIFLVQMCACLIKGRLTIPTIAVVLIIWAISIAGGIALNMMINRFLKKNV